MQKTYTMLPSRFVEYMKNWTNTEKPAYMDVAFYSERSIEDELDRASKSDIVYIAGSYLIMFAYVIISLSEFKELKMFMVDITNPSQFVVESLKHSHASLISGRC